MVDIVLEEKRKEMMSRIRTKGTELELAVRGYLHSKGFRIKLHEKRLPGKPNIVLPRCETYIFVHGCFWHQHQDCKKATIPNTNRSFWANKVTENKERDKRVSSELQALGWKVINIWQCKTRTTRSLEKSLLSELLPLKER